MSIGAPVRPFLILAPILPLLTTAVGIGPVLAGPAPADTGWTYEGDRGPEHWGALSPAYAACSEGRLQSPIDIRDAQPIPYEPVVFRYRSQPLEVVHDGRMIRLLSPPGSELRLRGQTFALLEVHFHVPGEHRIDGEAGAAEIHFLHRGSQGRLLVVAVRAHAGRRVNSVMARLLDHLPGRAGATSRFSNVGINPLFLLPGDKSYFAYTGSLCAPPCTEPVTWLVMGEPLELETGQVRALAQVAGNNARPIQPLNGRGVLGFRRP
jgi:carbonic anhydrase